MQKSAHACSACSRNCSSVSAELRGETPMMRYSLRQQAGRVQVEQAGQQLALGQVAGRAEQHDDVVIRAG